MTGTSTFLAGARVNTSWLAQPAVCDVVLLSTAAAFFRSPTSQQGGQQPAKLYMFCLVTADVMLVSQSPAGICLAQLFLAHRRRRLRSMAAGCPKRQPLPHQV